jgi:hypothetical protein
MLRKKMGVAVAAALLLAGCTYKANVAPTAAAAADIMPGRQVDLPASQFISPEIESLTRNASEGYACSANSFPVNAGPAIAGSIRSTNEAAFAQLLPGGTMTEAAPGAQRHMVFQLESFAPRGFLARHGDRQRRAGASRHWL